MTSRAMVRAVAAVWLLFAVANPAAAEWRRAESRNFVVYSEGSEDRLRQQVVLLEDFAAVLRRLSRVADDAPGGKLRVYIVRGREELRQVARVGSSIGGFYSAAPTGIAAFVDASAGGDMAGPNQILFHEYAHHFMMQYYDSAFPAWFVEGFAEYMSTAAFTDRHVELGRPSRMRAGWVSATGEWLPMQQILFQPAEGRRIDGAGFYAQSWLLTHYLLNDPARYARFTRYVQALGRHEDPRHAFEASFGFGAEEMHRRLLRYASGSIYYRRMERASIAQAPQITITRLPASAEWLLLAQAGMQTGREPSEAQLVRIRREAARLGDPFAKRVLAEAETMHGDRAIAQRLLDELLAISPNDVELLYLRGMVHVVAAREADAEARAAEFRRARIWFSRAHLLDQDHFLTLYRYAQSFAGEPEFASENNLNVLLLAHQLAPQIAEIRMNAASLLLMRGEFEHAEALLLPLASTAHSGRLAEAARTMIERARRRDNAGIGVAFDREAGDDEEEQPTPPTGPEPTR
jgi:Flp pilus assembly protein TadD